MGMTQGLSWWRRLLKRGEMERHLDAELRFHFDGLVADNLRAGMSETEARRSARLEFGGVEHVKEECRDARGTRWVETSLQDIRYGVRMLGKSPALTTILAITLALGIGVNTAIFSVVNGWLLRPLPVRAPEQLAVLASLQKEKRRPQVSYPDLLDFQKQANAFSDLFAFAFHIGGLSADGTARMFVFSAVTGNYFSALGVKPALGRLLLPGEGEKSGDPILAVLGYSYWQKNFGGDRSILGKAVVVDGQPATIVGVTPPEFHGTLFSIDMDGYVPLNAIARDSAVSSDSKPDPNVFWTDRGIRRLTLLGRLKPGVCLPQAQAATNVVAERLASQYPATNAGVNIRVIPERFARPMPLVATFVPVIAGLFLALPALVLLLACMNVANILLARAMARQSEMAIRAAVGGGRVRLIRQLLTESLLLASLGGIAGLALGAGALRVTGALFHGLLSGSSNYSMSLDTSFDGRVFLYATAAIVFTGMFVGAWPAIRATRASVNGLLHEGGRSDSAGIRRNPFGRSLVVVQIAGSLVLLVVSGLFVRSLQRAERMDLGFDVDHVLSVLLDPNGIGYDQTRTKNFYRDLEDRVSGLPGVETASLAFAVPLTYITKEAPVYVEIHPALTGQQPPSVSYNAVDAGYFDAMRIPLQRGRAFQLSDNETAPRVAIVNQAMAKRFWPNEDPIGKRFSIKSAAGPFIQVVGLSQNGQYAYLSPDIQSYFYLSLAQDYSSYRALLVRTSGPPKSLTAAVEDEIHKLAPDLVIEDVHTLRELAGGLAGFFLFRLAASLAAFLGILGLGLTVIGVYGVVSFSTSQRTHEIGVRMALGAGHADVMRLVLRQGLKLVIAGVTLGLLTALVLTRAIAKLLIGVKAIDPVVFIVIPLLLTAVALFACYLPARHATRINPPGALRWE